MARLSMMYFVDDGWLLCVIVCWRAREKREIDGERRNGEKNKIRDITAGSVILPIVYTYISYNQHHISNTAVIRSTDTYIITKYAAVQTSSENNELLSYSSTALSSSSARDTP